MEGGGKLWIRDVENVDRAVLISWTSSISSGDNASASERPQTNGHQPSPFNARVPSEDFTNVQLHFLLIKILSVFLDLL